jgi:hypothetical protein
MIDQATAAKLHAAAKMIEVDGVEGIQSATRLAGEDIAMALLITHLRRERGADRYPPPKDVEVTVNEFLSQRRLLLGR